MNMLNKLNLTFKDPSWKYSVCVSLVINSLLFGLFFLFLHPTFETNDDVGMMLTASGTRTGEPSEYLIYTNVIIGKILKVMYRQSPGFNWYSFYLYLAHFFAMVIGCYSVLRMRWNWLSIIQYGVVFIFFEYSLLMNLQFTSTAFSLALSGLCLLIASLGVNDKKTWYAVAISALLLGTAALIRDQAMYLVLLLAAPFLVFRYIETRTPKIPIFMGLSLLLVAASVLYNDAYYSKDPQWKEYWAHKKLRGQLLGYPKLAYNERTASVFTGIGWSQNDFLMFRTRFFFDENLYSKEKLAFINRRLTNQRSFKETLSVLWSSILPHGVLLLVTTMYLFLSFIFIHKSQKKYLYSIFGTAVFICVYLSYSARLPYRLFVPILLFVNMMTLWLNARSPLKTRLSGKGSLIIVVIVCIFTCYLLLTHVSTLGQWSKYNQFNQSRFKRLLQELPSGKDKLYIIWGGGGLLIQFTAPYSDLSEYRNLNLLSSGWMIHSPLNKTMLARFGVDHVYKSFNENNNVYLMMNNHPTYKDMFGRFMMEHYGEKVRFRAVRSYEYTGIYKVSADD
jgi:hypothetical protein